MLARSTIQSAEMRSQLLKLGISQMSAGSRTDVGAYHRENSKQTNESLVWFVLPPASCIMNAFLPFSRIVLFLRLCRHAERTDEGLPSMTRPVSLYRRSCAHSRTVNSAHNTGASLRPVLAVRSPHNRRDRCVCGGGGGRLGCMREHVLVRACVQRPCMRSPTITYKHTHTPTHPHTHIPTPQ